MKDSTDYKKITKLIAQYIDKRQSLKAQKEAVDLLFSILADFDNGDQRAIDILSGVCNYIFFDIPESSVMLPDLSGTFLLGADLAWHFHKSAEEKTSFERWKNLFVKELKSWKETGKIPGDKGLYKEMKIKGETVLIKYPRKKAD